MSSRSYCRVNKRCRAELTVEHRARAAAGSRPFSPSRCCQGSDPVQGASGRPGQMPELPRCISYPAAPWNRRRGGQHLVGPSLLCHQLVLQLSFVYPIVTRICSHLTMTLQTHYRDSNRNRAERAAGSGIRPQGHRQLRLQPRCVCQSPPTG